MTVKASMKTNVISVQESDDLMTAARQFVKHHVGMLPVLNTQGKLVGVLQLRDLLNFALPDFTRLVEDFDFVGSFGAAKAIQPSKDDLAKKVFEVMEEAVHVKDTCGLTRAFALLHQHNLTDLPIVDEDDRLVGVASRVDIGTALLQKWENAFGD